MHYNQYLFVSLLKLYDSKFNDLEYDIQYKLGLMQYKDFEESEFNRYDKTEYECITDYLKDIYFDLNKNRNLNIHDINISIRLYNILKSAEIYTLGELENKTISELLRLRNFGRVCLKECEELLKNYNLKKFK
jgi:DNA-directed RNA polymerase alpha subunit